MKKSLRRSTTLRLAVTPALCKHDASTEVRLTPTEWGIVSHLVRHPHRLVTYTQLILAVWGPDYEPDQNLLRVHMGHIRRKLGPDHIRPKYFITDAGEGHRFQPDVSIA